METAHEVFARAIASGRFKSFRDCWVDFAYWEESRRFGDDPGARSRAEIRWVVQLESVRIGVDEFEGPARADIGKAIEGAFEGFARMDHPEELTAAIRLWLEWREGESP